jgi:hypothetical protein
VKELRGVVVVLLFTEVHEVLLAATTAAGIVVGAVVVPMPLERVDARQAAASGVRRLAHTVVVEKRRHCSSRRAAVGE